MDYFPSNICLIFLAVNIIASIISLQIILDGFLNTTILAVVIQYTERDYFLVFLDFGVVAAVIYVNIPRQNDAVQYS